MTAHQIIDIVCFMMTSSNGNPLRVTGHLCGEFTGPGEFPAQRPVTQSFDVFFDLRQNKRLSKQSWGWWFETPSRPLWRHCNEHFHTYTQTHKGSVMLNASSLAWFFRFPESPLWLAANHRYKEAEQILRKMAKYNCKNSPDIQLEEVGIIYLSGTN